MQSGTKQAKFTRTEKSWIMYDWANSVYATIMMAAVFPIYFTSTANNAGQSGDSLWATGTAVAMAIIALMAPVVGALSDFIGYRKKLFTFFFVLGIVFTFFSAVSDNWVFLLCGYAISHIGFSGANLLYDSFLPDVTTKDRMDKVSGYGFAFGYIGGSTIPFIISIILINFGESLGLTGSAPIQISVAITAVWWAVFTIPFFKNVKQLNGIEKPKSGSVIKAAFVSVGVTAKKIYQNKKIFIFILAYFFYIDGVGTVINMSTSYGSTLGLGTVEMILALLVTQFVAFPCSIIFSSLTKRFGSLNMIRAAVCVYLLICVTGFLMGFGLEEGYFGVDTAVVLFWILAFLVGTVQGGIQAVSRSFFSQMVPPENSGEFFGFFDIFGKFASVLGPLLYAATRELTGRSSYSILSIILLFAVSIVILGAGNKYFKEA
jgi:UMF1 family MFS transporter